MANPAATPGIAVSFTRTPQAKDDAYGGLTEDSSVFYLDVMANDLGGNGKSLYSIDDGDNPEDLLQRDAVDAVSYSAHGARIWITADGKVAYDASSSMSLQRLGAGQTLLDSFTYAIQMGNGTISWATMTLTITGMNDQPVVTSVVASGEMTEIADLAADENLATHEAHGTIGFEDIDSSDTHTVSHAAAGAGYRGTFAVALADDSTSDGAGTVSWSFSVADADIDNLAAGEQLVQAYDVAIDDGNGGSATQRVTVTLTGTNDAPVITSAMQAGGATEIADGAAGENVATHTAGGSIAFQDVDLADGHTVDVTPQGADYRGILTASIADASTGDGAGSIAWNFSVDDSALDDLALGQALTQRYTVSVDDGHGGIATQDVVITLAGTNDAPVITSEAQGGEVSEDGDLGASGQLTASDVDQGAVLAWSAAGGAGGSQQNQYGGVEYTFALDQFDLSRNADPFFFNDAFGDGNPPPSAGDVFPNGQPATYSTTGEFAESNGRVVMDGADAGPTLAHLFTSVPFLGHFSVLQTDISTDLTRGLKIDDDFTLRARFDLVLPDENGEAYGIRFTDLIASGPNAHPGDDAMELIVRRGNDGVVRVGFFERDYEAGTFTAIQQMQLNLAPGAGLADQIVLRLSHEAATPGVVTAGFELLDGGATVFSRTFANTGRIFGTETPGDASDDEVWTRASFIAYSPGEVVSSSIRGHYGTLSIGPDGHWNYQLDNLSAAVQALAEGQTVTDIFTATVLDEHGASDTDTINVTVSGDNDGPVITSAAQAGAATEIADGTPGENTLAHASSGAITFHDVDALDTHTAAFTPQAAGYRGTFALAPVDQGGDAIGWTFTVADAALDDLASGQQLVQHYDVAVSDGHGGTATQTVTVTITGTNDAPVAGNDFAAASEDVPQPINAAVLLANDTDVDHDSTLTISGASPVSARGARIDFFGDTITYDPTAAASLQELAPGQTAIDTFAYTVTDNEGGFDTGNVTVSVMGANDPVAIISNDTQGNVNEPQGGGTVVDMTPVGASYLSAGRNLINGLGGGAGFGEFFLGRNDDSFTGAINVTSVFGPQGVNFFGTNYTSVFVNNNGNITFRNGSGTFTPFQITGGLGNPIIAPFFGDVDTRGTTAPATPGGTSTGSNLVYWDLDATNRAVTVTWDDVGYYSQHRDKLNAFQLQLVDQGGGNFAIVYRYEAINWTTGDASGGSGGLGGSVARAGYSAGNNVDYFEFPQSGNQNAMLDLENTVGNTGIPGVWVFEVRNGQVQSPTLSDSGVIAFTDVDLNDSHTATSVYTGTEPALGTLSLARNRDTTGFGSTGEFAWTYNVLTANVDYLAAGEEKIETFDVTVSDQYGSSQTQTIVITLRGTNDAVTILNGSTTAASVTEIADGGPGENAATHSAGGTLLFNDVDVRDVHTASVTPNGVGYLGTLSFAAADETANSIGWTFSVDDAALDALGGNDIRTQAYNVALSDGQGSSATRTITVTLRGTNDAPLLSTPAAGGMDLAVANLSTGTVGVLEGDGSGGFEPVQLFNAGGAGPRGIALADVNGNGRNDIIVANNSLHRVVVLFDNGGDGFLAPVAYNPGGFFISQVAAADLNGDGRADVVATNEGSQTIGILYANTGGGLDPVVTLNVGGTNPRSVAIGDVTGDGLNDIVTSNIFSNNVSVFAGNGAGSFAPAVTHAVDGAYPLWVDLGDVNGDGALDIATAHANTNSMSVLVSDGAGGFSPAFARATGGARPTSVAVGDVNGDGRADVVTTNENSSNLSVFLGDGSGNFSAPLLLGSGGSAPQSVDIGDVNGDSRADLVVSNYNTANVAILFGQAGGGFSTPVSYSTGGANPWQVVIGELAGGGAVSSQYTEGDPALAVTPALTVADIDSATLAGATVAITGNFHAGEDHLVFSDTASITGAYDAASGMLTLSGTASVVAYEAALRSVGYANTSDNPSEGSRTISFQVDDGAASSNVSNVVGATLTVVGVNDAPVAAADSYSLDEDSTLVVSAAGVLANDTDADSAISSILVSGPAHGTLSFNADGSFVYAPDENYNGSDSFAYRASDGALDSAVATARLTINAVNDAPLAALSASPVTATEGEEVTFDASGSSDPDAGDVLTYAWDLDNDGLYDDASGATIVTSFADTGLHTVGVRVSDGGGLTDDESVTVEISGGAPINEARGQSIFGGSAVPGSGLAGMDASAVWGNDTIVGAGGADTLSNFADAYAGDGGSGTSGFSGTNGFQTGYSLSTYENHYYYSAGTAGGGGGSGGSGGFASSSLLSDTLRGEAGADALSLTASSLGGDGAAGGSGGSGGSGISSHTSTSYQYSWYYSWWGGGRYSLSATYQSYYHGSSGGEGGDGAAGGTGGNGLSSVVSGIADGSAAGDSIVLSANAMGVSGGAGGAGGMGGFGVVAGDSGSGGAGGSGGYAAAGLGSNVVNAGSGDDVVTLSAVAKGGDGGAGGNGAAANYGQQTQIYYHGYPYNYQYYYDYRTYGRAGDGGAGGTGGDAIASISGNAVHGALGNDTIVLQAAVDVGAGGTAGGGGAVGTSYSYWSGYNYYRSTAGAGGASGLTGSDGAYSVFITGNTIAGGDGDDVFRFAVNAAGGSGLISVQGNSVDGGSGSDTLDLSGLGVAVRVDLAAAVFTTAGGTNSVVGIENVIGTSAGDVLAGSAEVNVMTGGAGADRFDFNSLLGGTDTIADFNVAEGDYLDISDVLTGYAGGSLADFVQLVESDGSTAMWVDADGASGAAPSTALVTLAGVTGLLLETLEQNGNVVA